MARQVRIEYAGAMYHVMARGNRREKIVRDDVDRSAYLELWAEAVKRTGWRVYAWILMDNHYHALVKTPEANLVEGMKWVQNTWTRRFNSRHQLWGHLFGGRYKSILCDDGPYQKALIDYIHLNPIRARMIKKQEQLEDYSWSSLRDYVLPKRKRHDWIAVESGLEAFELPDTARGRQQYLSRLNQQIDWSRPKQSGVVQIKEQTLNSSLKRGWYFGAEAFREKVLEQLEKLQKKTPQKRQAVSGYSGKERKDHSEQKARVIIREGLKYFGIRKSELAQLKKSDYRKVMIASLIREQTVMRLVWVSEQLNMGAVPRVSQCVNGMTKEGKYIKEKGEILRNID